MTDNIPTVDEMALILAKNAAYRERNALVSSLSRLYPAHLAIDESAEQGWQTLVCVHIWHKKAILLNAATGKRWDAVTQQTQVTWHVSDADRSFFLHLNTEKNDWDNHSTQEKYDRLLWIVPVPDQRSYLRRVYDTVMGR